MKEYKERNINKNVENYDVPIESVETDLTEDIAFPGNYIFYSIDIEKSKNIELTDLENLNEDIYINVFLKENNIYLFETNFWLLLKIMKDFGKNNPMEIEYPSLIHIPLDSYKYLVYQFAGDAPVSSILCDIHHYENSILLDWSSRNYLTTEKVVKIDDNGEKRTHLIMKDSELECKIVFQKRME
jgi:hypothetical protein